MIPCASVQNMAMAWRREMSFWRHITVCLAFTTDSADGRILRQNIVTDELMAEKVNSHFNLVAPFQERLPDSAHNPHFNIGSAARSSAVLAGTWKPCVPVFVSRLARYCKTRRIRGHWRFSWTPAYDVTGTSGGISYRLQIARRPRLTTLRSLLILAVSRTMPGS